jgi:hypothetical protein
MKNNIKIKNQIVNLDVEETKERLEKYYEIFFLNKELHLKENLIKKLIKNFNEIMNRLGELVKNVDEELDKIYKSLENEEIKNFIKIFFELNSENEKSENDIYSIELLRIDEEIYKFNNM